MPIHKCTENGKPGYKWGTSDNTKCYTYTPKSESSRKAAKKKALKQGMAIEGDKFSQKANLGLTEDDVHLAQEAVVEYLAEQNISRVDKMARFTELNVAIERSVKSEE